MPLSRVQPCALLRQDSSPSSNDFLRQGSMDLNGRSQALGTSRPLAWLLPGWARLSAHWVGEGEQKGLQRTVGRRRQRGRGLGAGRGGASERATSTSEYSLARSRSLASAQLKSDPVRHNGTRHTA